MSNARNTGNSGAWMTFARLFVLTFVLAMTAFGLWALTLGHFPAALVCTASALTFVHFLLNPWTLTQSIFADPNEDPPARGYPILFLAMGCGISGVLLDLA